MLPLMRRSGIWFLIAMLWLVIAVLTALRHGWQVAWLQGVVAVIFFGVAIYSRRKEKAR